VKNQENNNLFILIKFNNYQIKNKIKAHKIYKHKSKIKIINNNK
jgi:hypothetical protein